MDSVVEAAWETPDAYWRVEIARFPDRSRWYRVMHAGQALAERVPLETVQRILGDAMATLEPVEGETHDAG